MADVNDKHPLNISGQFFNDLSCVDCGLCPELAPSVFKRDDNDGFSYVYRQPATAEEVAIVLEAMESCPTESIGRTPKLKASGDS